MNTTTDNATAKTLAQIAATKIAARRHSQAMHNAAVKQTAALWTARGLLNSEFQPHAFALAFARHTTPDAEQMLTLAQAAAQLGVAASTLRHQVQVGRLAATLYGKTYVVSEAELDRYRRESLGKPGRPKHEPPPAR